MVRLRGGNSIRCVGQTGKVHSLVHIYFSNAENVKYRQKMSNC